MRHPDSQWRLAVGGGLFVFMLVSGLVSAT